MTCPKCGAFIGLFSCESCADWKLTYSDRTEDKK